MKIPSVVRVIGVFVLMVTVILVTFGQLTAAPAYPPATIDATLQALDPDEAVPVIITLRVSDRAATQSLAAIEQSAAGIRSLRTNVLGRHASVLTITKAQPAYAPLVFAVMTPRDMKSMVNDPGIVAIQPDRLYRADLYESTTIIGSASANAAGNAGAGTSVAVLDTGVLSGHEFLSGQVIGQACFSTTNSSQKSTSICPGGVAQKFGTGAAEPCADLCSHGTHVAGIVAGKQLTYGGRTFSGVAPAAKIIAVQVFSLFATSACGVSATGPCVMSYESDQILGLNWVFAQRRTAEWGTLAAVNMSLGGGLYTGITSCDRDPVKTPVDILRAAGIATVIASGNDSYTYGIASPACIATAIAVGATSSARTATLDAPASFSNRPMVMNNNPTAQGDRLLDLMAPGHKIMSATAASTTSYDDYQGTSMAAPHVAGAWAVLKSMVPTASVATVLTWLQTSGTTIIDSRAEDPLSISRIDVAAAARLAAIAGAITPTVTVTRTASVTKSRTMTRTRTATRTMTRNPRHTASKTRTRTRTATKTITPTRTATLTPSETATPSETPSATLTASVTMTATALPAWSTSVTNGGFETGYAQTAWTQSSVCCLRLISTAASPFLPRHGTYFAYLGGSPNETSILATTLTIPAEATYLRLHTYSYSPETVCGNDVTTVKLNSVLVATIPHCYATNTLSGYIPFSIDVTALRGQSGIPLEIKTVTNGTKNSHFLVDDVGYVSAPTDSIFRFSSHVFDYPVEDVIRSAP